MNRRILGRSGRSGRAATRIGVASPATLPIVTSGRAVESSKVCAAAPARMREIDGCAGAQHPMGVAPELWLPHLMPARLVEHVIDRPERWA